MDPKDLDDPRNRRPVVPPEEKRVNVTRQIPERPGAGAGGDEDACAIDPVEEPAHAPDEERSGPVADRARGERALFDREDANPDEEIAGDDAGESLTRDESPAADDVEVRHKER